ncbi:hypothetical protein M431DRAFT_428609 [Trichoderma harzianum CBS 226.95]|uniref:Uncharacterized protein n=1 Tax=Trichoderma harzianum CBS 226.95 TaxID=983964 RepID=A0A2T4ACG7_TRIHA|nr:hypothetical protein M431DRAFT_428609 [Trichoderma harzianum CBS 226.95]PTB54784.1 hypothetical protein M431DRAFT_428609 [Trichoderma harzianum CBS 226.95]
MIRHVGPGLCGALAVSRSSRWPVHGCGCGNKSWVRRACMPTGQASTGCWCFGMLVWLLVLMSGNGCEVDGLGPAHGGWLADAAMREDRMGAMPNVEALLPLRGRTRTSSWCFWLDPGRQPMGSPRGGASAELKRCSRWSLEGVSGSKLAQN